MSMMMTDTERLIQEINAMGLEELRTLWKRRYGSPTKLRSAPLMRMLLSWRGQTEQYGGIDADTRKALSRTGRAQAEARDLGVGAILTRNWKGRNIEVVVEEGGFWWEGTRYPSLSAAATAIAGTRWNGPRFFGLRDAA